MNYYTLQPKDSNPLDPPPPSQEKPPSNRGALLRGLLVGTLAFVVVLLLVGAVGVIGYARVAADLPLPSELSQRVSSFQSTRIYDRDGNLLNEAFDPNEGRRVVVSLDRIAPDLIQATIATEDVNFYEHPGVDPVALARAIYYAVQERAFVSGASTITQQVVKMVFLSPEQTIQRKVEEAILAAEISRRYTKDEILEIYLNEVYYGNLAYGIDAAAETYFGKEAADLSLPEAALLAGLPQLPAYYDPYTFPDRAKNRQAVVLGLMVEAGVITPAQADDAWLTPLTYQPLNYDIASPHFTLYVRQQLETLLGTESIYKAGLQVTTTLDPQLQAEGERIVLEQVTTLAPRNVSNGALVAMRPESGEILAMVGSADFDNVEIAGQVNMALSPRQPGSSIKPLVYLAAFEQQPPAPTYQLFEQTQPDPAPEGDAAAPQETSTPTPPPPNFWTPGTLLADIEEAFPDGVNPPYVPTNYDEREHGMVTMRSALANSYNIPAVRALQSVGIPEFIGFTRQLGITTLTRPDYGLSLSLGSGEVPLLELTGAFGVIANQGVLQPPLAILKIEDNSGNVICELGTDVPCRLVSDAVTGQQVVDPINASLMTAILSDNQARAPVFGLNSALSLGNRPAAAKTGTTNDYRDSLTVGYTPQLVTGVWMGNTDNTPMDRVAGASGAAQIWNRFMQVALADEPVVPFTVNPGAQLVEICADTGSRPSPACPERITVPFHPDRPPLPPEQDLWQIVRLDRASGQLATEFTPQEMIEERPFKVYPLAYRQWAEENGIPQPPEDQSDLFEFEPAVVIQDPLVGSTVEGVVTVRGSANVPGFTNYELQYGVSHDPGAFSGAIWGPVNAPVENNVLGQWDTRSLFPGPHTLRLLVRDQFGNQYESRIQLFVNNPETESTATPTNTPTWTPTPQSADDTKPTPTWTPMPVVEPTATWTPVPAVPPTLAPTATWTPVPPPADPPPTNTPTWTPVPAVAPTEAPLDQTRPTVETP